MTPLRDVTAPPCPELDAAGAEEEAGGHAAPHLCVLPLPLLCRHRTRLTHLLQAAHWRGEQGFS